MRVPSCGVSCSVEGVECVLACLFLRAQMLPKFQIQKGLQRQFGVLHGSSETVL